MFLLDCSIQKYAWGKKGTNSLVAKLKESSSPGFKADPNSTYAELWMGSHPSCPSLINDKNSPDNGKALSEWLKEHPESLGEKVLETFEAENGLPYLLKVLSVEKALSIQAHPSKSHAEVLHREHPNLYPDPNHKPEMAIALTPFEALCGFRPLYEIQRFLQDVPEFSTIIGSEASSDFLCLEAENGMCKEALRGCFDALMKSPPSKYQPLIEKLANRLSSTQEDSLIDPPTRDLFLQIYSHFPGDIGCFGLFFFNHLKLEPGQALFLAANEPHAYLLGDCVECMACSDNVVRAGLTPKHKDVDILCKMLTYRMRTKEENLFKGIQEDPFTTLFKVPVPDFAMASIKIPPGSVSYTLLKRNSASILLLIEGDGMVTDNKQTAIKMDVGCVVFVSADISITFNLSNITGALLFQAFNAL